MIQHISIETVLFTLRQLAKITPKAIVSYYAADLVEVIDTTTAFERDRAEAAEAKLDLMRSEAELLGTYLSEATAEQAALWKRTKSILEVAIARGEKLGYSDDDYRALWRDLTGADWQSEIGD